MFTFDSIQISKYLLIETLFCMPIICVNENELIKHQLICNYIQEINTIQKIVYTSESHVFFNITSKVQPKMLSRFTESIKSPTSSLSQDANDARKLRYQNCNEIKMQNGDEENPRRKKVQSFNGNAKSIDRCYAEKILIFNPALNIADLQANKKHSL